MSGLFSRLEQLPERDRRMLLIGVPVILLLVLYLVVFKPLLDERSNAEAAHQFAALELRAALQGGSSTGNESCAGAITSGRDIAAIAARVGLMLAGPEQGRYTLSGGGADDALMLVRSLYCSGIPVAGFSINRDGASTLTLEIAP